MFHVKHPEYMKYKIALIGSDTLIGESLYRIIKFETDHELHAFYSSDISLIDDERIKSFKFEKNDLKKLKRSIIDYKPDILINASLIHDPLLFRGKSSNLIYSNVELNELSASISKIIECHVISFSSHLIFDGTKKEYTEESAPTTRHKFSQSILAGENAIRIDANSFMIFRLGRVFGQTSYNNDDFIRFYIFKLLKNKEIYLSKNYYFNPVFTDDISLSLINSFINKNEIINICSSEYFNEFDIISNLSDKLNINKNLIKLKDDYPIGNYNLINHKQLSFFPIEPAGIDNAFFIFNKNNSWSK